MRTHHWSWVPTGTGTPQTGSRSWTLEWRWSWSRARWWRRSCLRNPPAPRKQGQPPPQEELSQTHHSDEGWSHLKHLLSKQVVPHLPLDVPVHQVTLKTRRETVEMRQSDVRPKLLHPYVTSPSGRGGCRRAPKDLWSRPAGLQWRFLTWTSSSETGSLGWRWEGQREGPRQGRPLFYQLHDFFILTHLLIFTLIFLMFLLQLFPFINLTVCFIPPTKFANVHWNIFMFLQICLSCKCDHFFS